jgi:hypothetical protein
MKNIFLLMVLSIFSMVSYSKPDVDFEPAKLKKIESNFQKKLSNLI